MAVIDNPEDLKKLWSSIDELNGVDKYVPSQTADESLTGKKAMLIPVELFTKVVLRDPAEVGLKKLLTSQEILHVASVNLAALEEERHPYAAQVAVTRALILSKGILVNTPPAELKPGTEITALFCKRSEIRLVDYSKDLVTDSTNHNKVLQVGGSTRSLFPLLTGPEKEDYVRLAVLAPCFGAIEFQKTNHHYLPGVDHNRSYAKHFKSAEREDLAKKFNYQALIYDAIHWMGPFTMESYKQNLANSPLGLLPRGIKIKSEPTPAGTAVCKTQIAVWRAISVFPGAEGLLVAYEGHLNKLREFSQKIDADRLSYHVFASLFNKHCRLDDPDTQDYIVSCANLAAIAQAFIEVVGKGTDLGRAKALKKHSDQNFGLFKIASAAFTGAIRKINKEAVEKTISEALLPSIVKVTPRTIEAAPLPVVERLEDQIPIGKEESE